MITTAFPASTVEQAFIGAALMNPEQIIPLGIRATMARPWFADSTAGATWEWMLNRYRQSKPCGFVEVLDCAKTHDGKAWIERAVELSGTPAYAAKQIQEIRAAWLRREGALTLNQAAKELADAETPDVFLSNAARDVLNLAKNVEEDKPLATVARDQYEAWQHRKDSEHIYWPLQAMRNTYGFIECDLICLLAQPSCGKTAFALQCAATWAKQGHGVAIKSLESKRGQIASRLIAALGDVNVSRVRRQVAFTSEREQYLDACGVLERLPIEVDDKGCDLAGVYAWAVGAKQRGAKVLILDNLKHIRNGSNTKDVTELHREHFLGCKWIRDDLELPFMVLHHTNDEGKAAWSRDIERDADVMIYMTEGAGTLKGDPETERYFVEFTFAKYRDEASGALFETEFKRKVQKFTPRERT